MMMYFIDDCYGFDSLNVYFVHITGRRPDETVAALVVGHAGAGPHPPAHAQPPGQRDHVAQWTKVRPARARSAWRHHDGRLFRPGHRQVTGAQVRRGRLHLPKVPAAVEPR